MSELRFREALNLAADKIGLKTRFVTRQTEMEIS